MANKFLTLRFVKFILIGQNIRTKDEAPQNGNQNRQPDAEMRSGNQKRKKAGKQSSVDSNQWPEIKAGKNKGAAGGH